MDTEDKFAESLDQLAGLSLDDVAEVRFEALPPMKGGFEIVETKRLGRETSKGDRLIIEVKLKVIEVASVADPKYDSAEAREKLIGKTHTEGFPIDIADPAQGLGRFKAFMVDTGYKGSMKIGDIVGDSSKALGTKFMAQVKQRPNKDDKDRPYVNCNPIVEKASGQLQV